MSLGIEHIRTAPYHPQSNGQAEKFVDLLKTGLSKATGSVDSRLREFLHVYRSTPSYNLGAKSPAEILNNRAVRSTLDLLQPAVLATTDDRSSKMRSQFNNHHGAKWKDFRAGCQVYFKLHQTNTSWKWTPGMSAASWVQSIMKSN